MKSNKKSKIYTKLKTNKLRKNKSKTRRKNFLRKSLNKKNFLKKSLIKKKKKKKKRKSKSTKKKKKYFLGKSLIKNKIQSGGVWSSYYEHSGNNRGFIQQFERYQPKYVSGSIDKIEFQNVEFTLPHLDVAIFQKLVDDTNKLEVCLNNFDMCLKFNNVMSVICQEKKGRILSKKATDKKIVEVLYDPTPGIANYIINQDSISFVVTDANNNDIKYKFTDKFNWFNNNHLVQSPNEEPKCKELGDLNNYLQEYIIEKKITERGKVTLGTDDKFKIIIYPDPNAKSWRSWLFEGNFFTDLKTKVFQKNRYFNELIKDLYNAYEDAKIADISGILTNESVRGLESFKQIISNSEYTDEEKDEIKMKLDSFFENKIRAKLQNLFNQPNSNFSFVVVFLKKDGPGYKPMVHHLSEIKEEHTNVLKIAQESLDTTLPEKLGYNIPSVGEEGYKNYIAYNLPGFFHLKVVYFHPSQTNFDFPSYQLQNMITLNEIIFGSTLSSGAAGAPFFSKLKRYYYIVDNYWLNPIDESVPDPASSLNVEPSSKSLYLDQKSELDIKINEFLKKSKSSITRIRTIPLQSADKEIFHNCSIIKLDKGVVNSSFKIYLTKEGKFYEVILEGYLNNIKTELLRNFSRVANTKKIIFECESNIIYTLKMDVPVYKIKSITLIEPNLVNPFKTFNSFPTMMNTLDFEEINKAFPDLHLLDYYSEIPLNVILQPVQDKIKFKKVYKRLKLTLPNFTYYLSIIKDEIPNSEDTKKVIWIMKIENTNISNYESLDNFLSKKTPISVEGEPEASAAAAPAAVQREPEGSAAGTAVTNLSEMSTSLKDEFRLKDIYDLHGDELGKIINELNNKKEYEPAKHFLGVNNSVDPKMNTLHLHILPKKSDLYKSFVTNNNFTLSVEFRMKDVRNIQYNLEANPDYYSLFKKYPDNRLLSAMKINI